MEQSLKKFFVSAVFFSIGLATLSSYIYWDGLSHHPYSYAAHYNLHDYFEWYDQFGNQNRIDRIINNSPKNPKKLLKKKPKNTHGFVVTSLGSEKKSFLNGDVVNYENEILKPAFALIGFLRFIIYPILFLWLISAGLYTALYKRSLAFEICKNNKAIILYLLGATIILAFLGCEFLFCIFISMIPIALWFITKNIVYGLIYTAAKAIEDAKKVK